MEDSESSEGRYLLNPESSKVVIGSLHYSNPPKLAYASSSLPSPALETFPCVTPAKASIHIDWKLSNPAPPRTWCKTERNSQKSSSSGFFEISKGGIHLHWELPDLHNLDRRVKRVGQRHVAIGHSPQRQLGGVKNIVHAGLLPDRGQRISDGSDVATGDGGVEGALVHLGSIAKSFVRTGFYQKFLKK
jgi:hypothetical protein